MKLAKENIAFQRMTKSFSWRRSLLKTNNSAIFQVSKGIIQDLKYCNVKRCLTVPAPNPKPEILLMQDIILLENSAIKMTGKWARATRCKM